MNCRYVTWETDLADEDARRVWWEVDPGFAGGRVTLTEDTDVQRCVNVGPFSFEDQFQGKQ